MSVHAQAPLIPARKAGESSASPPALIELPATTTRRSHAPPPPSLAVESRPLHAATSQETELRPAPKPLAEQIGGLETETITRTVPHVLRDQVPRADTARAPEPLLEEVAVASSPPVIAPAAQPAHSPIRQHGAGSEPTEVHVHIGRIEVIAATEPAPKKIRAAHRNTLPLSDYLAGRRRP